VTVNTLVMMIVLRKSRNLVESGVRSGYACWTDGNFGTPRLFLLRDFTAFVVLQPFKQGKISYRLTLFPKHWPKVCRTGDETWLIVLIFNGSKEIDTTI